MREVGISRFPWALATKHSPVYPNYVAVNPHITTYQQPFFTAGFFEHLAERNRREVMRQAEVQENDTKRSNLAHLV